MNNLATTYSKVGELKKAHQLHEKSLELKQFALGERDPSTLLSMYNLAKSHAALSQDEKSLALFRKVFELRKETLGSRDPLTLRPLNNIGVIHWRAKNFKKSVAVYEELASIRRKEFGLGNEKTVEVIANLGVNYLAAKEVEKAIATLEEVKDLPGGRWIRKDLRAAYLEAGQKVKFLELAELELKELRNTQAPGSPKLASFLAQFGDQANKMGLFSKAETALRESLLIRQKIAPDQWLTFNAESFLGESLLRQEKFEDAKPTLEQAYEGMKERFKSIPRPAYFRVAQAIDRLIELAKATDDKAALKKWEAEKEWLNSEM